MGGASDPGGNCQGQGAATAGGQVHLQSLKGSNKVAQMGSLFYFIIQLFIVPQ